jgi:hypothetical protein
MLARYGWAASLTRDGLARTDVLAVHSVSRVMVEIQVKAMYDVGANSSFRLGVKGEISALSEREWFVLVLIPTEPSGAPRSFVVPRDHVAAATWINHENWLTEPGIPPGKRNVGHEQARVELPNWLGYEDRWDLLAAPTNQVPVLLPSRYRDLAMDPRVGLPRDHPWRDGLPTW